MTLAKLLIVCSITVATIGIQLGKQPQPLLGRRAWLVGSTVVATASGSDTVGLLPSTAWASAAESPNYQPLQPGKTATYNPIVVGDWIDMPDLQTSLAQSRIGTANIRPFSQGLNLLPERELYYSPFLFGAWNVTATLKRKIFPFGTNYLPSSSLIEGSPRNREEAINHSCTFEQRFFSTLANTIDNQITVNLGIGVPQSRIIQDRAFNIVSISKAYGQLTQVQQVDWDYQKEPTRLFLDYGAPVAEDMRPLGRRRATVYINGRTRIDSDQGNSCVLEQSRSVLQAPGSVVVTDSETTTEYHPVSENHVTGISRIAVFLSPNPNSREGLLWEQVGGRAVALYDYELDMRRIRETFTLEDGSSIERACVQTPKGFVQCE